MLSPASPSLRPGTRRKRREGGRFQRVLGGVTSRPAPSGRWWAGRGRAALTCMMQGRPPTAVHSVHHAGRLGKGDRSCEVGHPSRGWCLQEGSPSTPAWLFQTPASTLPPHPPTRAAAPAQGPSGSLFPQKSVREGEHLGAQRAGARGTDGAKQVLGFRSSWGSGSV